MISKQLKSLQIEILDPDVIELRSVVEVTDHRMPSENSGRLNTVFDPRIGPFVYGDTCATCNSSYNNCPGHFSHLICILPFYQPFFLNRVYHIIQTSCWNCLNQCDTTTCIHCDSKQGKWKRTGIFKDQFYHRVDSTKKFVTSTDVMTILKYFDATTPSAQPRQWLLTTVLPIIPLASRPSILHKSKWLHNSLSTTYCSVVKENKVLLAFIRQGQPSHIIQTQWRRCQDIIYNIYDVKPAANNQKYCEGIRQRLDGKQGRYRRNLMGKFKPHVWSRFIIPTNTRFPVQENE